MAYDKELPKNFFNFNGRAYPENLPVYWSDSKNDWQVSSEENPLPTGDYGMTEGGVWIPKKVSDDGAAHTQLTGSNIEHEQAIPVDQLTRNFKVMLIDADFDGAIPPGEDKTWDIYAPDGWILSDIVDVRMLIDRPANQTEGYHILAFGRQVIRSGSTRGDYAITSGEIDGGIHFKAGTGFETTNENTFPQQSSEILTAYKLLSFDDETPIQAYYRNHYDVEQNFRITIRLKCIAEKKVG